MKALALVLGAALFLTACQGMEPTGMRQGTISQVNVTTDLGAIRDPAAARYWQTLNGDLQTAIAAELADRIDPAGAIVTVAVDELSLTEAYLTRFGQGDSRLNGQVDLTDPGNGQSIGSYTVSVRARDAARFLPPTADNVIRISPNSADFYAALVRAFARGVAEAIRTRGTAGS